MALQRAQTASPAPFAGLGRQRIWRHREENVAEASWAAPRSRPARSRVNGLRCSAAALGRRTHLRMARALPAANQGRRTQGADRRSDDHTRHDATHAAPTDSIPLIFRHPLSTTHRRYMRSLRTLTKVRHMNITVQINTADVQQVNNG